MSLVFALSPAYAYDIAAVAVWFVIFPAFITALIALRDRGVAPRARGERRGAGEAAARLDAKPGACRLAAAS